MLASSWASINEARTHHGYPTHSVRSRPHNVLHGQDLAGTRLAHARETFQPILDEFKGRVRLKWYDVEFYTAKISDIWMIESKDHHSYQLFCEKLRETPFWDRFFLVHDIFPGELNAWAKNYEVEALQS
jgi:hypothetical protein